MKNNVIVEISIVPIGTGNTSLSGYVADCLKILNNKEDIKYQLTPMGTIIEGRLDKVFDVIKSMHEIPFTRGAMRVVTTIKIDDRRDKKASMRKKIESVKRLNPKIEVMESYNA